MKIKLLIVVILISLFGYYLYGQYLQMIPKAKDYGKMEVEKFVNVVVNHATLSYKDVDEEGLIIVGRNETGDISSVDFNLAGVNEIANELVYHIETDLNYIMRGAYEDDGEDTYSRIIKEVSENKGIVSYIPVASLMDVPILSYLNVKVPLKYEMISNVKSEVKTDVKNYGINHVVVKIVIEISVQQNVVSPFFSEPCVFTYQYPLVVKLVNGLVPGYYSVYQNPNQNQGQYQNNILN